MAIPVIGILEEMERLAKSLEEDIDHTRLLRDEAERDALEYDLEYKRLFAAREHAIEVITYLKVEAGRD